MLTLGEAKTSRIKRVAGVCPDSEDFLEILNDATRELMRAGNWWGTVKRATFCVYDSCLVFPRYVGTLLAFNRGNHSIPPKNHWYGFDDVLPEDVRHWNSARHGNERCNCSGNIAAVDFGTVSVFNQIPCLNDRFVRFYIVEPLDAGKTITIFGIDGNGQTIRSTRPDGTVQEGLVLTFAIPFVESPMLVRRLDRVIKDVTSGPVFGYQFDGNTLYNMAEYQPSETLPEYRFSKVTGRMHHHNHGSSCGATQISALVKLKFIPVANDGDLVGIDNVDALAIAVQSLKTSDAYDSGSAENLMARAIHKLNQDLRDKLPIEQTPARVHYQGTAHLRRQQIGYLT